MKNPLLQDSPFVTLGGEQSCEELIVSILVAGTLCGFVNRQFVNDTVDKLTFAELTGCLIGSVLLRLTS